MSTSEDNAVAIEPARGLRACSHPRRAHSHIRTSDASETDSAAGLKRKAAGLARIAVNCSSDYVPRIAKILSSFIELLGHHKLRQLSWLSFTDPPSTPAAKRGLAGQIERTIRSRNLGCFPFNIPSAVAPGCEHSLTNESTPQQVPNSNVCVSNARISLVWLIFIFVIIDGIGTA